VTLGTPRLRRIGLLDGLTESDALRLAASADLVSLHPYAAALVRAAQDRDLPLTLPDAAAEKAGQGVEGTVDGRRVAVGSDEFLRSLGYDDTVALDRLCPGDARSLLGVDGRLAAWFELADPPREGSLGLGARLRAGGVVHVAMLTGDRRAVAERHGETLGVDRIYAEQTPGEKLEVVKAIKARPGLAPVVMVGDGINDAPALAVADVGIAMGSSAASASTETADAVVLVDRVDRVADAIAIGRRSLGIARQSVLAGMALSLGAMTVAAFGFLTPVAGAIFQEAVDVAVILNALRALRG
jgi:P-type E1-E2 ATPase